MTSHVAVLAPSVDVTVMFALPFETAVTTPLATVATEVLSEFHVTDLSVALFGKTVAVKTSMSPFSIVKVSLFKLTLSTWTVLSFALTLTIHVSLIVSSSSLETVIVAVPADKALTFPRPLTIAMSSSEDDQLSFLFKAFSGRMVATRLSAPSSSKVISCLLSVTDLTDLSIDSD